MEKAKEMSYALRSVSSSIINTAVRDKQFMLGINAVLNPSHYSHTSSSKRLQSKTFSNFAGIICCLSCLRKVVLKWYKFFLP